MANVRQDLCKSVQDNRDIFRLSNLPRHFWGNIITRVKSFRPYRYKSGQGNNIFERQLENIDITSNSSVLSPDKDIRRRSDRHWWSKKTKKSRKPITNTEERWEIVPTQTLLAHHYLYFSYNFNNAQLKSWLHRAIIQLNIESEFPIDTYIVDETGFQNFQNGREYTSFGGFINSTQHRQEIRVPHEGFWYLIVNNNGDKNTAIHYEVR